MKFHFIFLLVFALGLHLGADSLKLAISSDDFSDTQTKSIDRAEAIEFDFNSVLGDGHGGANENSITTSLKYTKNHSITEYDAQLKWLETKKTKNYNVSLFASIGYRSWEKDLTVQQSTYEKYRFSYAELGLQIMFHENDWHLGIAYSYRKAIDFMEKNTQGSKLVVPLQYDLNDNVTFEVAYEQSEWGLHDLKQKTTKAGVIIRW